MRNENGIKKCLRDLEALGFTQSELGTRFGLSQWAICRLANGHRTVIYDRAIAIKAFRDEQYRNLSDEQIRQLQAEYAEKKRRGRRPGRRPRNTA